MVLKNGVIYFAEGKLDTASFTEANKLIRVAAYGLPQETIDEVEVTVFNDDYVKEYDYGYSDMGDVTIKLDICAENVEQLAEIKALMDARAVVSFGIIVDKKAVDLNVKFAGKIKSFSQVDGDITPGVKGETSFTIKPITKLKSFTAPTEAE